MKQFIFFLMLLYSTKVGLAQNENTGQADTSINKSPVLPMRNTLLPGLDKSIVGVKISSPYTTSFVKDGLAIAAAVGTTLLGYSLIENKIDLTPTELAGKTMDKLPFFDRGSAGYSSTQADKDSYILFDAAYAIPVLMTVINKNERSKVDRF